MGRRPGARLPYCVWLDGAGVDRATVGGKGASLGRLAMLGAAVPPACAITTAAYRTVATALHLPRRTAGLAPDALALLRHTIVASTLPEDVLAAIDTAYDGFRSMSAEPVELAVRSSATVEDAEAWSFAGLHDTVLGVRSREGLERAIRQCWASMWSDRAVQYRILAGLESDECAIAVVVQRLMRCDVSFVLFTIDPLSGRDDHAVIIASWGLGEAIVSGLVTPDHIVVDADGAVVTYEVGQKERMILPGAEGHEGTQQVPVPRLMQQVPVLTGAQVAEIAGLGRSLEAALGFAADIEGGVVDGDVFLFQARPITTLFGESGRRKDDPERG